MPCLINSKTLKMISQVESFLCPNKQGTPKEGWRIQQQKICASAYHNKDEDNSPKNHNQNNTMFRHNSETNHNFNFKRFQNVSLYK